MTIKETIASWAAKFPKLSACVDLVVAPAILPVAICLQWIKDLGFALWVFFEEAVETVQIAWDGVKVRLSDAWDTLKGKIE